MAKLPAGIRKRKNGGMEKRFTVNGVRYSVYGRSLHEISEKEQSLRVQLAKNKDIKKSEVVLDDYFEEWLDEKRLTVKSNTIRSYMSYYRPYIGPEFGKVQLSVIERKQVVAFQKKLAEHLEAATNNITITVLRIILNGAVKDGLIANNPAEDIKRIKSARKATNSYHRSLTEEEQRVFMCAARTSFYYELFAFQLLTGMRLGEIGALKWSDVDMTNNVIRISKTLTRTESGKWCVGDSPKSDSGNREIPINSQIRQILELLNGKIYQRETDENYDNLFKSPCRKIICNRNVNEEIHKICRKLAQEGKYVDYFTSHAFRDTFATRYIEQGGSPQTLKTILGHSSLSMTMDLYSHVLPNTRQKEMNNIKMYIGGK